jgi:phage baseplate assembly protein W
MALKFNASKYTTAVKNTDFYSDFNNSMDIHPGSGDVVRVLNDAAVMQSVKNLLLTEFYERPFQPTIGCRLRQILFEDISPITSLRIQTAIEDTLGNHERRINLIDTIVEPDDENNGYNIRLRFSLINSTTPIEMNFFLDRIR